MRVLITAAAAILLAGCASAPKLPPAIPQTTATPHAIVSRVSAQPLTTLPSETLVPPQPVTLYWSNPDADTVANRILWGCSPRDYTNSQVFWGATEGTIEGFTPGATYYFAATAINSLGLESDFSQEFVYRADSEDWLWIVPNHGPPIVVNRNATSAFYRVSDGTIQSAASPTGPWTPLASAPTLKGLPQPITLRIWRGSSSSNRADR